MSKEVDSLKQQRANTKGSLSRIKNILLKSAAGEGKKLSALELKCRLGIVEAYYKQAIGYQTELEKLDPENIDKSREELEDLYIEIRCQIQTMLGDDLNSTLLDNNTVVSVVPTKLPPLPLPKFEGKYSEYKNFITSFNQIIDREYNLTNIEKFNHLLGCLRGPALEAVKAFPITNENYPKALERLKSRYDNDTLIFMDNVAALFNNPSVSKQNGMQLRSLVDSVSALYSSLLSLGTDENISHALLIYLVLGKVDEATQKKWKESLDFQKLPTWDDCSKFLERRCQYFESLQPNANSTTKNESRKNEGKQAKEKANAQPKNYAFSVSKTSCYVCSSSEHKINKCPIFKGLLYNERVERVEKLGLCGNCLSKNHETSKCTSTYKCKRCSASHHSMLHPDGTGETSNAPSAYRSQAAATSEQVVMHSHMSQSIHKTVMLATAIVLVRDATGTFQLGRALLDSCSQVDVITDDFARKLLLPRRKHQMDVSGIGDSQAKIKHMANSVVKSRVNDFEISLEFCITSNIAYQPNADLDISSWQIPANVKLADEEFCKSKRVDLLIGTEHFFDMLCVGQIKLGPNLPSLQKTLLGWIVAGKVQHARSAGAASFSLSLETSINENLEQLWALETVDTTQKALTDEQQMCESHFVDNVRQATDGRVIVKLPFKEEPCCLGDSRSTALKRFTALERRLQGQGELKTQYVAFMHEYEALGHMSLVENPDLAAPHFYIPHHCVMKLNSTTTKLRVVFDASCQTTTGKSLNDVLMVGPTVQEELYMLLVLVEPTDCRYQYILWRDNVNDDVKTYQLNTVTYGTAAAPFLAVRSLQFLADKYEAELKIGAQVVRSSFYVDDLVRGADSIEELKQIKHEVTEVLKRGRMELTKWHSNYKPFIEDASIVNMNFEEGLLTSALGISWHQTKDVFMFEFKPKQQALKACSKRSILSIASSLFDPLGLLSPLLITTKILLQELWLLKITWDESVPQNISTKWHTLLQDLSTIKKIEVPRYCLGKNVKSIQIHGFCDASIRAYGCCVYFRSEDQDGNFKVHLLTSKSRVAPTKKRSLPQLELCGAQLLAKLVCKIKDVWQAMGPQVFLWTDSTIVLHWLRQHSATLSTFVGNRVSDIQENTGDMTWRHVPSSSNPADLISRGSTVEDLRKSIWFAGPTFLLSSEHKWPANKLDNVDTAEVTKEIRKAAFRIEVSENYILSTLAAHSSYTKCLRIVAWMFRFHRQADKTVSYKSDTNMLTPQELQRALWSIVYNIQQQHFSNEIRAARQKEDVQGSLKHLNPFLESTDGFVLLKVGGRLEHADLQLGQKHPVILPRKCEFVELYVRHLHLANYHAGAKALIGLIRQRFWIINARSICRKIVRNCVHCTRYRPKLLQQMMGNLPVERLTPSRPFARCAVDFCGPVLTYLRIRGKTPYKTYICVFVCMATKAVHIEIVSDLSTDAFIAALKRFVGRRGLPTDIFCDNATNFVGANNKLQELKQYMFNSANQSKLVNFCTNEFINFRFIPPRAPHFAGLCEAAVKTAKGHLNRSFLNTRLTYEELTTAVVDIEAIMNSRPISPVSSDPSDFEALTPAHFLIGGSLKTLPEREVNDIDLSHIERWRRVTAIKQAFWRKWSRDYLNELQGRTKWQAPHPNVAEGALVMIFDENAPPQRWMLGRVVKLITGKDGLTRVAEVKTRSGVFRRVIHKLALVPC